MADAVFPFEILYQAIGLATKEDDNDYSTTKSCALVCYGLFGFCRQLMFEAVEVDSNFSKASGWDHPTLRLSTAGFVKALSGNSGSSLGKAIRKLSFVVSRVDIENAKMFQRALKTINHLEYLMMTQANLLTPLVTRELEVTRNTFEHLLGLPTLSAICISDFPIFRVGSGLKAITVWASRPHNWNQSFGFSNSLDEHRPELESVTFHGYAAQL
ncbi:hypothetical protein CPB83DRAFT_896352 [Crepidotus variabilis]|uniref:Uncharacterized protein n=1 Tax=Crepidotus variabilis TaxID=179855 RepID=A0A9P6JMV5_9AGAR|nr:hypothetical protein CPB83DRAFT_896352 [Crepidotus variabilis]